MTDRATFEAWMHLQEVRHQKRRADFYPVPSLTVFRQLVQEGRWRDTAAVKWPGDEEMAGVADGLTIQGEG